MDRKEAARMLARSTNALEQRAAAAALGSVSSAAKSAAARRRAAERGMPRSPGRPRRALEDLACTCPKLLHTDRHDPRQVVIDVAETLRPFAHQAGCPRGRAERRRAAKE